MCVDNGNCSSLVGHHDVAADERSVGDSVRRKVAAQARDALFELKDRYVPEGIVYKDAVVADVQMIGLEIELTS